MLTTVGEVIEASEKPVVGGYLDLDFEHLLRLEPNCVVLLNEQHTLAERLFEAHFCEGLDVGDAAVLEELAVSTGLERERTQAFLAGGEGVSEVEAELAQAVDVGVSGVPCYLLGGVFPFPGVQEDDVLEKFITRAKERMTGR